METKRCDQESIAKAESLFTFIRELNKLKSSKNTHTDYTKYEWFCRISDLPDDPEHIKVTYRDITEEGYSSNGPLLAVRKPTFSKCPEPDECFVNWLNPGWDSYKNEVSIKRFITTEKEIETQEGQISLFDLPSEKEDNKETFTDDKSRVISFSQWNNERTEWVEKQKILARTMSLFTAIYDMYFELQKNSEKKEIIVCNGVLIDRDDKRIKHPVITKRVTVEFDAEENVVSIEDTNSSTELYSTLFQNMSEVNKEAESKFNDILAFNDIHPLDRNCTPGYLKVLVHQLDSDSMFSEDGMPEMWTNECRYLMYMEPCFILRDRLSDLLKNIQAKSDEKPVKPNNHFVLPSMKQLYPVADDVLDLIKEYGVEYIDNRERHGVLWIIGGDEIKDLVRKCEIMGTKFTFKKGGGSATSGRDSWWAK